MPFILNLTLILWNSLIYRPIHSIKFSASIGDQLDYNGSRAQVDQTKQRKLNSEYWNPWQMHPSCTCWYNHSNNNFLWLSLSVHFTSLLPLIMHNFALKTTLYSKFALPWRYDIMEYSSILFWNHKNDVTSLVKFCIENTSRRRVFSVNFD